MPGRFRVPASSRQGYSSGCSGLSDLKPVLPSRKGFTGKGADRTSARRSPSVRRALVSRSRQDIDTQILHVDIEGSGALCRVENEQSTALVGNLGNFFGRRHAARDIRDVREDDVIETIAAELAKNDRGLCRMSLSISPPRPAPRCGAVSRAGA